MASLSLLVESTNKFLSDRQPAIESKLSTYSNREPSKLESFRKWIFQTVNIVKNLTINGLGSALGLGKLARREFRSGGT